MTRSIPRAFPALMALLLGAMPAAGRADTHCAALDGITPLCDWQRPEDFEVLPGGRLLLVSEYGGLDGRVPGRLRTLRAGDGERSELFPGADGSGVVTPGWGDPACPGPPGVAFSPHGIHHGPAGGATRVLAVNHGGREAVELFELVLGADGDSASLTWRGCVLAPAGVWMNDVVGLPDGGLAVTHMIPRGTPEDALFAAEASRAPTGEVHAWLPDRGWTIVPGTAGGLPNGLEISPDGATLYVDFYFGDAVAAIDRASGRTLWRTEVPGPDNSSWAADGRLLVASHPGTLAEVFACNEPPAAGEVAPDFCLLPYQVIALDPATGEQTTLFAGGERGPFGAATVAVEFDGALYLGAYTGTRMARIALPAK